MKSIIKKLVLNNVFSNFLIRSLRLENFIYRNRNPYLSFKVSKEKTLQENAGYSNRPEINEVIEKSKKDLLNTIKTYCLNGDKILDVGCGPGQFLSLLKDSDYNLYATDINSEMIAEAKKNVPSTKFYHGDFIKIPIEEKFKFIYCIGVLIYISKVDIEGFFRKLQQLLQHGGILYLNYPHAISLADTYYKDLTYIQYSPEVIEKIVYLYFEIIHHYHAFDGRKIYRYDKKPYKSLNPDTQRTYKNSYLLIAKKK